MLKTSVAQMRLTSSAYHLGEGRVLKTVFVDYYYTHIAYHLGEGRVLKTLTYQHNQKA